jgi:ankyrin repeat protein
MAAHAADRNAHAQRKLGSAKAFVLWLRAQVSGDRALVRAAGQGGIRRIEELLAGGAQIGAKDGQASTPLISAVVNGRLEAARWLLERGADIDAGNYLG